MNLFKKIYIYGIIFVILFALILPASFEQNQVEQLKNWLGKYHGYLSSLANYTFKLSDFVFNRLYFIGVTPMSILGFIGWLYV